MQPTPRTGAWSAWAGWAAVPRDLLDRRRVHLTVHELADMREMADLRRFDWARLPPHQIALYTPKQLRQLIRLESTLSRWPPTSGPDRPRWRADRTPDGDARWRMQEFLENARLEHPEPLSPRGATGLSRPARAGWESAARGWAAGAVLLAVLVLLVRALERCLQHRLFKGRRRSSEEWPTPNVLATSHRLGHDLGSLPRLDDSDSFPSESRESTGNDFPPPYSECANSEEAIASIDADKPIGMEEPPPPYSACYFSNPKDGIPTVHFYSTRGEEIGQSSTDTQAPVITNVREEDDKIVGCEAHVAANVDQTEATVSLEDNAVDEPNSDIRHEVSNRQRNEHTDHVVQIDGVEVISQEGAVAV